MVSSAKSTSVYLFSLAAILSATSALPFREGHGNSKFAIVNVDGSSEPSPPPPQPATDTVTTTIAQAITLPPYGASPTQTITITAQQSSSLLSRLANSSTISFSTSSSVRNATFSSTSRLSTSSILAVLSSSTPCEWGTTTSSSSTPTPTPTPCGCEDDDDEPSPSHEMPFHPKATLSTIVTSIAKPSYSYPASAHAMLPSGMTAPLPVLPTEPPQWVNKTQIPYYKKRAEGSS